MIRKFQIMRKNRNNKRLIAAIAVFLLTVICTGLVSCSSKDNESVSTADENLVIKETESDVFPEPVEKTWEKSDNALSARYVFTLEELCERLQDAVKDLGVKVASFRYEDWQELSKGLVDDNGVKYTTYYYSTEKLAFTAAVEDESEKVMNIGCGSSYEMFSNEDEDFQVSVLTMSALIACVAGGYDIDDMDFMYSLFIDVTKNTTAIYYNNNIYLADYDTKEDSSVLFMISAADERILKDWSLIDYREYLKNSSEM